MGIRKNPRIPSRSVKETLARYRVAASPVLSLADALFTTTQQRVLGALYGQPERSFTVSELIATTAAGSGAVQRELAKLTASGLLTMRPIGNQKHYQANPAAPIHAELVGIVQKTVGLADVLREALDPLTERLGREVNPVVLTAREFRKRAEDPGFVARVLDAPRILLMGAADDA